MNCSLAWSCHPRPRYLLAAGGELIVCQVSFLRLQTHASSDIASRAVQQMIGWRREQRLRDIRNPRSGPSLLNTFDVCFPRELGPNWLNQVKNSLTNEIKVLREVSSVSSTVTETELKQKYPITSSWNDST